MILKNLFYYFQAFLFYLPGYGQNLHPQLIAELPQQLQEASGIVRLNSGHFIHINDSGNPACLVITDSVSNLIKAHCLPGIQNRDWEALAYHEPYLYIGDFGNNENIRRDLKIYRIGMIGIDSIYEAGILRINYERQKGFPADPENRNFDMEAMVFSDDSLFLFSKNRTQPFSGYTYLYALPAQPGNYNLSPADSFKTGTGPMHLYWITGAALNSSGNKLVLLGYDKLWMFHHFRGNNFFGGEVSQFHFKELSQKEAVDFINDSTLVITDERADFFGGGFMYKVNLPTPQPQADLNWPVSISPEKHFQDSIEVLVSSDYSGKIFWEIFNTRGERPLFGTFDADVGADKFIIQSENLPPGGYVLNLILDNKPHAFKLKKLLIRDTGSKK